ncbi:hypothetical protein RKD05_000129 [Microbacterium sp. SLBN-111]
MPEVRRFAAPFICTMWVSCTSFEGTCRAMAERVDPHAMPIVIDDSMRSARMRAAVRAVRSSRSASDVRAGVGTTCAVIPNRSAMRWAIWPRASSGGLIEMVTSPTSRACWSSRDTEDRETRISWAMASIVRSCM